VKMFLSFTVAIAVH